MSLQTQITAAVKGLFGEKSWTVETDWKRTLRRTVTVNLDPSTTSATNTTKRHVFYADTDMTVEEVSYVPDAALTVNATNHALMRVYAGNGAAAAATQVGIENTATGANWVAGTPHALTLTTANCDVDEGETLAAEILKVGSGVAVSKGALVIHYIER
jgi:hypothetical protein